MVAIAARMIIMEYIFFPVVPFCFGSDSGYPPLLIKVLPFDVMINSNQEFSGFTSIPFIYSSDFISVII